MKSYKFIFPSYYHTYFILPSQFEFIQLYYPTMNSKIRERNKQNRVQNFHHETRTLTLNVPELNMKKDKLIHTQQYTNGRLSGKANSNDQLFEKSNHNKKYEILQPFIQCHKSRDQFQEHQLQHEESAISLSKISEHYKQIENILESENYNLKEHNKYLIKVISGMQQKQKHYKAKMHKYEDAINQLEKEKEIHSLQMKEMKTLLKKMDSFISQIEEPQEAPSTQENSKKHNHDQLNRRKSFQGNQELKNLDNECNALISEYHQTNDPEIRKQCISLIKQIKEIKNEKMRPSFRAKKQILDDL